MTTDERLDTLISDTEIEIGLEDGDCALSREDYFEGVLRSLRALAAAEREIESAHEQIKADAEYLRAEVTRGDRLQLALAAAEQNYRLTVDALNSVAGDITELDEKLAAAERKLEAKSSDLLREAVEALAAAERREAQRQRENAELREALEQIAELESNQGFRQIAREALGGEDAE